MRKRSITAAGLATALAITPVAAAKHGADDLNHAHRSFHGKVTAVNRDAKRFRVRLSASRTVRFTVKRGTVYRRLSGFQAVHRGLRVEVEARHVKAGWVATKVQRDDG